MNNFTTLEQARRLQTAGFPQGDAIAMWFFSDSDGHAHHKFFESGTFATVAWHCPKNEVWASFTAAEIMEEIKPEISEMWIDEDEMWCFRIAGHVARSKDLRAALVEAYVKSKEGR